MSCRLLHCTNLPRRGLEPPREKKFPPGPEPGASANSATWAERAVIYGLTFAPASRSQQASESFPHRRCHSQTEIRNNAGAAHPGGCVSSGRQLTENRIRISNVLAGCLTEPLDDSVAGRTEFKKQSRCDQFGEGRSFLDFVAGLNQPDAESNRP